jgi:signal transduction histidine kinase/CheY-like chemotaxis protein
VIATVGVTPLILIIAAVALFLLIFAVVLIAGSKARKLSRARKKAEIEVRRNGIFLEAAHKVARLGTWELNLETRQLKWSEPLYQMFGVSSNDWKPDYERFIALIHQDDRQKVRDAVSDAMNSGSYEIEYRINRPDGRIMMIRDKTEVVRNHRGDRISLQGTIHDISCCSDIENEVRILEDRILHFQKLENLALMVRGISHDFNNLLTVILGNAEVVLRGLQYETPAWEGVLKIQEASIEVEKLTRQMLEFTRGKVSDTSLLQLSEVVEEMSGLLKAAIGHDIIVDFSLSSELPEVEGNSDLLQQVVMNLVVNASSAIRADTSPAAEQGTVRISTYSSDFSEGGGFPGNIMPDPESGSYVILEVSDNGSPVDGKALDEFSKSVLPAIPDELQLSLFVVKKVVEDYGGAVLVSSGKDTGNTFRILLPASDQTSEATDSEVAEPLPVERPVASRQKNILLVDDEQVIRDIGAQLLELLGFPVLTASDGAGALEVLREHTDEISTVLLDMTMPGLTGKEIVVLMRRIAPTLDIVICSGYREEQVQRDFEGCEISGFLHKPYSSEDLAGLLYNLSKRH